MEEEESNLQVAGQLSRHFGWATTKKIDPSLFFLVSRASAPDARGVERCSHHDTTTAIACSSITIRAQHTSSAS